MNPFSWEAWNRNEKIGEIFVEEVDPNDLFPACRQDYETLNKKGSSPIPVFAISLTMMDSDLRQPGLIRILMEMAIMSVNQREAAIVSAACVRGLPSFPEEWKIWDRVKRSYPRYGNIIYHRRPHPYIDDVYLHRIVSAKRLAMAARIAARVEIYSAHPYLSRTQHRGLDVECDEVQDLIQDLKDGDRRAADESARALSKHPRLKGFRGVVVPAPRSKSGRSSLRGFAEALVRHGVGSRVEEAVVRVDPVESSRMRRRRGLPGVQEEDHIRSMGVQTNGIGPDEPVLVVDDIVTTGSTIRAVAQVLQAQGHRGEVIGAAAGYYVPNPGEAHCPVHFIQKSAKARYKNKRQVDKADGSGKTTVYDYSKKQVEYRNREKAKRVEQIRQSIDRLRKQYSKDLTSEDEKTRATALVVALMDVTYERVGNETSADSGHYGVTGWKVKHITFGNGKATIKYVGKSGVKHTKTVEDKAVVSALKKATEGKKPNDEICAAAASDANAYLKPYNISAKDLRGYHANREVQERLKAIRSQGGSLPSDPKEREKKLKSEFEQALQESAKAVGHEPSTLKSQYLVPGLESSYLTKGEVLNKLG